MDDRVVSADTQVTGVTFFEDRAEVARTLRCHVGAGRTRVHARGITLLVDDRSLTCKATVASGVEIVFSRVRRRVDDGVAVSADTIAALEVEVEDLRAKVEGVDRALGRASADGRRAIAMLEQWTASLASVPSRAGAGRAELGAAYDAIDRATHHAIGAQSDARIEREAVRIELARAAARLEQARSRRPGYEAFAEIELVAHQDTDLTLDLVYRTPCALWRPEHVARLVRDPADPSRGTITITTLASVWQFTGETWADVPCRFSTARPARSASAPHLRDDVLATRKKSDQERRQVVVEAREQAITAAGLGQGRGTRDLEEMPGVEDGGEAQWLSGRSLSTIASDGRPVRVEIGERSLPCEIARVSFPELGPATHLRATATLPGPAPLLAGPVTIGRETEIVGRSVTKFIGAGEPFELGFGVDDGLRVRRKVVEKRKTTPVTGTQQVERTISLFLSNLGDRARSLDVVERVPVSEVEDVRIEIDRDASAPMRRDVRDGLVTFTLELAPHATKELTLAYRVEAKSNVVLPAFD